MKKFILFILISLPLFAKSKQDVFTVCLSDGSKCYENIIIFNRYTYGKYFSFYVKDNDKLKMISIKGKYVFIPYK